MGAGASIPEKLDKPAAMALAGDRFDEAQWELHAEENFLTDEMEVTRKQFLDAAAALASEADAPAHALLDAARARTADERAAHERAVLDAALAREARRAPKASAAAADYSKSLSGTAEDTKNEKAFNDLMRAETGGGDGDAAPEERDPLLVEPEGLAHDVLLALAREGAWLKFLGAAGCWMWINSETKETVAARPDGYEEPEGEQAAADPYHGYEACTLAQLPEVIGRLVDDEKKTPIFLDGSDERKIATFFAYKGARFDATGLALGMQNKARPKVKDLLEGLRASAVAAMKKGATLCLDLGEADGGKAPFAPKLCKADGVRLELFKVSTLRRAAARERARAARHSEPSPSCTTPPSRRAAPARARPRRAASRSRARRCTTRRCGARASASTASAARATTSASSSSRSSARRTSSARSATRSRSSS